MYKNLFETEVNISVLRQFENYCLQIHFKCIF